MTSKALAGGNRAVTALGGVAVIAHQQSANPMYGRIGMELIKMGMSPQDALDFLLRADTAKESRQVAMIDAQGRTAAWTNGGASAGSPGAWRGHQCGTNYCAQGNSLTGPEVVQAVAPHLRIGKGKPRGTHARGDRRRSGRRRRCPWKANRAHHRCAPADGQQPDKRSSRGFSSRRSP